MKEITDDELDGLRTQLSCCSPLVQSLVVRIDRVEKERDLLSVSRDKLIEERDNLMQLVVKSGVMKTIVGEREKAYTDGIAHGMELVRQALTEEIEGITTKDG